MRKILFILLAIAFILPVSATELFYADSITSEFNLSAFGASGNAPNVIIMQEIPKEFLTNVTYFDGLKIHVHAGGCNPDCVKPNGKLYFRIYKKVAGVWTYQTGSFFSNISYYDSTYLTNSFSQLTIDNTSDYGIGFYTDVSDYTNGSWSLYGSNSFSYDVSTGYNVWKTHNSRICTPDVNNVCNPYNIYGYNAEFTDLVNHPVVHTVFPEVDITTGNGYPDNMGLITMYIYGQTLFPTPSPTPTPIPTGTPIVSLPGNRGNLINNNTTIPDPFNQGDNQQLLNNSVNGSFKAFANGMGYDETVGGYLSMAQDYMMIYILFGMLLFIIMLFNKKGR